MGWKTTLAKTAAIGAIGAGTVFTLGAMSPLLAVLAAPPLLATAAVGTGLTAYGPLKLAGQLGNGVKNIFGGIWGEAKGAILNKVDEKTGVVKAFNKASNAVGIAHGAHNHMKSNSFGAGLGKSLGQALSKKLNLTPEQADIVLAQVVEDPILAELVEDGELSAEEIEIISAEIDEGELTLAPLDDAPAQKSAVSAMNQHIIDGNAAKKSFSENAGKLTPEERFTEADFEAPKSSIPVPSMN